MLIQTNAVKIVMTQSGKFEKWLDTWWNKGIIAAIIHMWQCYCEYFSEKTAYLLDMFLEISMEIFMDDMLWCLECFEIK